MSEKVVIENVNVPGYTTRVDARKYLAMRACCLAILPTTAPGFTQAELRAAVLSHLPQDLFPKGATSGWWAKTVQLDLEAKGLVVREQCKPLRWHQVRSA